MLTAELKGQNKSQNYRHVFGKQETKTSHSWKTGNILYTGTYKEPKWLKAWVGKEHRQLGCLQGLCITTSDPSHPTEIKSFFKFHKTRPNCAFTNVHNLEGKTESATPVRCPFHSSCLQCRPCRSSWQRSKQRHQAQHPPSPGVTVHNSEQHQDHSAYQIWCWLAAGHWQ